MNPFRSGCQRILWVLKPALMLAVFASGSVFAQYWNRTAPSTTLANPTDNVGIGVTTPTYKLDVNGTFHIANGYQAVFSNSGTAALPSITFYNDANTGLFNPGNADVIGFATQGTERMRIDQAGVVGIGTTNPGSGYKLDVNGVLHVTTGNQALFSYTSTANMPAIAFDINNNTGVFSPTDDNLCLSTGGQERLRINPNGYVGIGTTNPGNGQSVSLHVNGPVMLSGIPALATAATYYLSVDGTTGILKTRTATQVFSDISGGACPPNPMNALGDMMYGGNVGLCTRLPGNSTATKKFLSQTGTGTVSAIPAWAALTSTDVGLGNVENTKLSTWTGSSAITTLGTIAVGSMPWSLISGTPTIPAAQVNSNWNATSGLAQILNKPTTLAGYGITDAAPLNHGVTTGYIAYANSPTSWTSSSIFTSGGNLGIGTTALSAKLNVSGNVLVSGGDITVTGTNWVAGNSASLYLGDANHYIRATNGGGLKIGTYLAPDAITLAENTGNLTITKGNLSVTNGKINVKGWSIEEASPDYVFEKDYKLPSIKEVETYVKENKHLAGVPSAKDMSKNGLDLTVMNMKLLKKVEELTLYTIEQNKRIEALEKKLEKR